MDAEASLRGRGPWQSMVANVIALLVFLPLAAVSRVLERLGRNVAGIPLSCYRKHSFYTLRTDARDRFGTPMEHRFTRGQITEMMARAGEKAWIAALALHEPAVIANEVWQSMNPLFR